jgi:hypothetical protein
MRNRLEENYKKLFQKKTKKTKVMKERILVTSTPFGRMPLGRQSFGSPGNDPVIWPK